MTVTSEATVTLNGKPRQVTPGLSLSGLLEDLGIDRRLVAVAHNDQVIPRDNYDSVQLQDGDRVEVVRMVGGG